MPAGDGTGPMGLGRMSGRGAGYCAGFPVPGYLNPLPGRGWGMGRGWGRGRGRGRGRGWGYGYSAGNAFGLPRAYGPGPYCVPPSGEFEAQALRTQAEYLQGTLEEIRKRLAELEASQRQPT